MTRRNTTKQNRAKTNNKRSYIKWLGGVAAIALLIVVAALIVIIRDSMPNNAKAQQVTTLQVKSVGSENARMTMVEYADFQCPFCGMFAKQTEAQFMNKYVKTGVVRFEYKHFPIIGQESLWAAHAGECAAEQDRFWDYHNKLFQSQAGENKGAFSKDKLKSFAKELGLQEKSFNACMDSGKYLEAIRTEYNEGMGLGVRSTPTFFLNGTKIEGAQPLQVFQDAVQNELFKTIPENIIPNTSTNQP